MAPDLENLALTDLEELTDIVDTDLLHINSGGTDYKGTFENVSRNLAKTVVLAVDTDITEQVNALPDGYYRGEILSGGHQLDTGMPVDDSFWVYIEKSGSNARIEAIRQNANGYKYFITKSSNGWESDWTLEPTRAEVSALAQGFSNETVKYHTFSNDSLLTTQADAFPDSSTVFGKCYAYGKQTETGSPINSPLYVRVMTYDNNARMIEVWSVGNASDSSYRLYKYGGTWGETWTQQPMRGEITSINNGFTNAVTSSDKITFTPVAGSTYDTYGGCYYYKKGNQVHVHIGMSGLTANSQQDVLYLPSGYKPLSDMVFVGTGGLTYTAFAKAVIATTGTVRVTSADTYAMVDCFYVYAT